MSVKQVSITHFHNSRLYLLAVLLLGIILGSIYINLCSKQVLLVDTNSYSLTTMLAQPLTWNRQSLLVYLLERRGIQLVLIIALLLIAPAFIARMILVLALGVLWGSLASIQTICDGLGGLLISVAVVLPQGICYTVGILYTASCWCRKPRLRLLLFLSILFVFGILAESYVNPLVLEKLYRILG